MSTISVYFKNRVTFDSEDPGLGIFLHFHGYSLDEFLDDDTLVVEFLNGNGTELLNSIEVRG